MIFFNIKIQMHYMYNKNYRLTNSINWTPSVSEDEDDINDGNYSYSMTNSHMKNKISRPEQKKSR